MLWIFCCSGEAMKPAKEEEGEQPTGEKGLTSAIGPLSDVYFLNGTQSKFVCVGFSPTPPYQLQVSIARCGTNGAVVLDADEWQRLIEAKPVIHKRLHDPEDRLQDLQFTGRISVLFKTVFGKRIVVFRDQEGHSISLTYEEWCLMGSLSKLISDILFHKKKEETDVQNQIAAFQKYMLHVFDSGAPFDTMNFTAFTKYIRSANFRIFLELHHFLSNSIGQNILRQHLP